MHLDSEASAAPGCSLLGVDQDAPQPVADLAGGPEATGCDPCEGETGKCVIARLCLGWFNLAQETVQRKPGLKNSSLEL
eukprot:816515-Alexandrium_andersonii.AAC.1